ncbi:MAG: hypothetical protein ACLQFM_07790 [Terriglobales bacterium]|jgi:hypothetical protein
MPSLSRCPGTIQHKDQAFVDAGGVTLGTPGPSPESKYISGKDIFGPCMKVA